MARNISVSLNSTWKKEFSTLTGMFHRSKTHRWRRTEAGLVALNSFVTSFIGARSKLFKAFGISDLQFLILLAAYHYNRNGFPRKWLAEMLKVDERHLSKLLGQLELPAKETKDSEGPDGNTKRRRKRGLIVVTSNPESRDARERIVLLTGRGTAFPGEGKKELRKMLVFYQKYAQMIFKDFRYEEILLLITLLNRLHGNLKLIAKTLPTDENSYPKWNPEEISRRLCPTD